MGWIKSILDWIEGKPWKWFTLAIIGFVPLVLRFWITHPKYCEIIDTYGVWIFLGALAASICGSCQWVADRWPRFIEKRHYRERIRNGSILVRALSPDEKAIIAEFLAKDTNTLYYKAADGVLAYLKSQGFLFQATLEPIRDDVIAFNLQRWVRVVLNGDAELAKEITGFRGRGPRDESPEYPIIDQDVAG